MLQGMIQSPGGSGTTGPIPPIGPLPIIVADTTERDALTNLLAGQKVIVLDDGAGASNVYDITTAGATWAAAGKYTPGSGSGQITRIDLNSASSAGDLQMRAPAAGEIIYYMIDCAGGTVRATLPDAATMPDTSAANGGFLFIRWYNSLFIAEANPGNRSPEIAPFAGQTILWSDTTGANPQSVTDFVVLSYDRGVVDVGRLSATQTTLFADWGTLTVDGGGSGAVDSVAGKTGAVVLNPPDIIWDAIVPLANLNNPTSAENQARIDGPRGAKRVDMGNGNEVIAYPVGTVSTGRWIEFGSGNRIAQ